MSKILVLHGPDPEEIDKAKSLVRSHSDLNHQFIPLTDFWFTYKRMRVSLSVFIDDNLGDVWLRNFIIMPDGRNTLSFARYLLNAIDSHDKVVILPCPYVTRFKSYILASGYALGKDKVIATLNYSPVISLSTWYEEIFRGLTSTKNGLRNLLKKL